MSTINLIEKIPISWKSFIYSARSQLMLIADFFYDYWIYRNHAIMNRPPRTFTQYQALIEKEYHKIEKGLSFPHPQVYFGKDAIAKILFYLNAYEEKYGLGRAGDIAINTLKKYIEFHTNKGMENNFINSISNTIDLLSKKHPTTIKKGGTQTLQSKDLIKKIKIDLEDFFANRHSIRDFSAQDVDINLIKKAISMALKTPSVCNRQGWKLHLITQPNQINQALKYQNGNRGFSHQINKLLIINMDLNVFNSANERYQYWIDGGLFAMSIIYGLHSLGLGTCCLNWSQDFFKDREFRHRFSIPSNEKTIMFLAIGHLPPNLKVCQSPRRNLDEILKIDQ